MSILNHALKKTQQQLEQQAQAILPDNLEPEHCDQVQSIRPVKPKRLRFGFAGLLVAVLVLLIIQSLHSHHPVAMIHDAMLDPTIGLSLQGVMASDGAQVALINGNTYHQGEQLHGAKIQSIQEDHVVLVKQHKPFTLHLSV